MRIGRGQMMLVHADGKTRPFDAQIDATISPVANQSLIQASLSQNSITIPMKRNPWLSAIVEAKLEDVYDRIPQQIALEDRLLRDRDDQVVMIASKDGISLQVKGEIPQTLAASCAGMNIGAIVSHPSLDHDAIIRSAEAEEGISTFRLDRACVGKEIA